MTVVACPPYQAPVHGVVEYSDAEFLQSYPEFTSNGSPTTRQSCFTLATFILRNSCNDCFGIDDANQRQLLLYLLTAHFIQLRYGVNGQPASGVVGRVSDATEGSVSVGLDWPEQPNAAWFAQTQYGATFWQLTAPFRTARYFPAPQGCDCGPLEGAGAWLGPTGTGWPGWNGGSS
jgi:hypothetical protein